MSTSRINKTPPQAAPAPGDSNKTQTVQGPAAQSRKTVKGDKSINDGTFDVEISGKAKDRAQAMQKAFEIAKNSPDVREDKVQQLKEQIKNGSYQADAGNIADGMLKEAIKDQLAENPDLE